MKAIGILWNSMNEYTNMAIQDIDKYSKITDIISINFDLSYSDFISKIYPYTGNDLWKLKYKVSHLNNVYDSNEIKIIFLDIPSCDKIFVERKGIYLYKEIEELKKYIRNKYKKIVENYAFDNVYHMTDDEKEYVKTIELIVNYIINYFDDNDKIFDLDKILYKKPECFEKNIGKRRKLFLFDNQIIYKEKKVNSLENFAEVFCYHFFKKMGINTAEYYFSNYMKHDGVVTKNFIRAEEIFIDGTHLIDMYLNFIESKKIDFNSKINHSIEVITKYNNIEDLSEIFKTLSLFYKIDLNFIVNSLKETFAIDLLFLQSDRHSNNWGILINCKDKKVRFAPLYDNSNIFNFNKPDILEKMSKNMDNEQLIYSLAIENNPMLLRLHKHDDLFTSKSVLIENIDDHDVIEYIRILINKIDDFGLDNLVNEIIADFPIELDRDLFQFLILKLLSFNISYIKENLLLSKKKLLE